MDIVSWHVPIVAVVVALAFFVSASAGLGGSLILVPALALLLGAKQGVALAALLLAGNNVVKWLAYRATVPYRSSGLIVVATMIGTFFGARLLVSAPVRVVEFAVVASLGVALVAERWKRERGNSAFPSALAFGSGATSGFAGTSGPLKGIAIKSLEGLDRLHIVGAAAIVSVVGDVTKTAVFTDAGLLSGESYAVAICAVPLMIAATLAGRRWNSAIGEVGYDRLFWAVMGGYTLRMLVAA